ncbi:S-layer homology domain-containing protein [Paenibacillus nanensis]|nr:S-layer homology domain-containing protein [Paenibacillus nanensis]
MVKLRKQPLLFLTALLLLSLWFPGSLHAANEPVFRLKATNRESKVMIEVKGQRLSDLYAYQFNLQFDPKHMRFVEADSPVPGFTIDPIVEEGDILFAHSKVGNVKGIKGEAVLATFTFERMTGSPSSFTLHGIKLVDSALDMVEMKTKVQVSSDIKFKDIAGHWAEASILEAVQRGWINGYSDQTFRPQKQVTRAEFVTMLVRSLELPIPAESKLHFTDADRIPAWAEGYIAAAVNADMIAGYADGSFQADKLISRAEMASILVKSQGIVPAPDDKPSFADTDDIPGWAQSYIAAAAERGWIKGVGDNRFAPLKNANRAESVHLIVNLK